MSERLEVNSDGQVRKIQRYYDQTTWPFMTAVAYSLVSAACLRAPDDLPYGSLMHLRAALATRGIPGRDISMEGVVFNLGHEEDLIRLNERVLLGLDQDLTAESPRVARSAIVHPKAKLIGPVVVQSGAEIDARAVVVGPTVIGANSRVGTDAVVVQSVLAGGAAVSSDSVVRSRVVFEDDAASYGPPIRRQGHDSLVSAPRVSYARPRAVYPHVKHAVDRLLALIGLLALLPIEIIVAVLIKLDSKGGAFFADLREGQHGKRFRCWKFRTMRSGADLRQRELLVQNQVDGPQFKLEKDPRLTGVGRWLRPMSLDELPQLFNVLSGEMSLIGPRPSPFRENQTCVPWREARLSVRPGITGLWQVCRHDRQDGDFHQWIYFDLLYVQHMSLWLDLKILLATVITGGGRTHVPLRWMIPTRRLHA